ncbi:MAG TPA: hypothetical protein VFQ90_10155, partial [Stellaceae bacterium]|nr:hypothetical protein [Stellaceae bacterium]
MRDRQERLAAFVVAGLCIAWVDAFAANELTGAAAYGDWRTDAPGVRRKITAADMPAPFATGSARESARVVAPPAGARLSVPPDFAISLFADRLQGPRAIRVAQN